MNLYLPVNYYTSRYIILKVERLTHINRLGGWFEGLYNTDYIINILVCKLAEDTELRNSLLPLIKDLEKKRGKSR